MASDAVELADSLVFTVTGRHLNDLQRTILRQVCQGRKYLDIAHKAGYTEGHIKDVASQLWQVLSKVTGERITKATLKSALERYCKTASHGLQPPPTVTPRSVLGPQIYPTTTNSSDVGAALPGHAQIEPPVKTLPPPSEVTSPAPYFVGRHRALADLQTLVTQGHRAIVIQGEGGLGKTTLAQHFVSQSKGVLGLELLMAKETADVTPVEWVVEEWLRQDFGVEPGHEFGVTLDRLKRQLREQPVIVFIDNLEPCLDAQGRFIEAHRRYRELLRVLTDVRSRTVTVLTSRDRMCEPGIPLTHYRLPGLAMDAWQTYFIQQGIVVHHGVLADMHLAYGGNAKAMEILCGCIRADFEGDMVAYWQVHSTNLLGPVDLKNLVESQVERLKVLDPNAYTLFCRLGVYRFQDVAMVSLEGLLTLIDDLPKAQHQQAVASLRNRSLLEGCRGLYWLHPVVREGALAQLQAQENALEQRQRAHRNAAKYWTGSVSRIHTIEDALQSMEAYYHHVAIEDWGAAARVILHSRDNQWGQFLPLGSTLYRMGRVKLVTDAITAIIDRIPHYNSDASELYNILGDLHWIQGRLQDAIACQESAIAIAQGCLQGETVAADSHRAYYLTMLLVDSQLSLGLYHLDLWELDEAANWFKQVIDTAAGTRHQRWSDKATICLALVQSYQGATKTARRLADGLAQSVLSGDTSGRYAFFTQLLGHTYLNLGEGDQARKLFEAAIKAAEAGQYLQIKANALSGLGRLEYLIGNQDRAVAHHHKAIDLLQEVGAQCDLATAHLQLAFTLANRTNPVDAIAQLQAALAIFDQIPAPQQVARVRQYLKNSHLKV
jgi:tetratricopeptide (TPR) repeat protein